MTEVGQPFGFDPGNEFDPAFSNDGKQLAFISDKSGQFKIYICYKKGDNWTAAEEIAGINSFNNGVGNIRYPSFNYDGSKIYFSADFFKDSSNVDIFYSEKTNEGWSVPFSLGAPVNSALYDGQPSISPDDKVLYFVRNKTSELTSDCKMVLVSTRQQEENWSKPEELPIPVNVDCEQAPKIALDNKTLYFSSVREGGKGGFDIYRSKLIAKNVWIPAESIDTLNTPDNDYSPSLYFNKNQAFYCIEKAEKKSIISKMYKVDVPDQFLPGSNLKLSGVIRDKVSNEGLKAQIAVFDPVTLRLVSSYNNNTSTGGYELFLPGGSNYLIDFNEPGYSHNFINIEALYNTKNEDIVKDIYLYNEINLLLNVFDNEIFRPINADIEVKNSKGEVIELNRELLKEGRFKFKLPLEEKYLFSIQAAYFEPLSFEFDLTGIVQFEEFERDAELVVKKVDFQIDISDEDSKSGIPVDVLITNLDNNEVIRTTGITNSEGKYVVKLREGDRYNVSVSPKGYSYYNTTVDLKKKETPKKLDVQLKQLKEETKLTLKNITFEFNSAELNSSSFEELDRVVKLMKDNPTIKIEISAHTDNTGSDAYNLRLSKRRAKSVMDYLLDKKVNANRLVSQGYGKTKPLVPNDNDENRAINRRVELKINKIE